MARSRFVDVMLLASLIPILGGFIRWQPNNYLAQKPFFEYTAFDELVWWSKGWETTLTMSLAICTAFITAFVTVVYLKATLRGSRRKIHERAIGKDMSSKVVCSGSEKSNALIDELERQIHGDCTDFDKLEAPSENGITDEDTEDEDLQAGASSSSMALPLLHKHAVPNAIIGFAADGMPRRVVHREKFDAMMELKAKFNAIMDLWATRVRPEKVSKSSFQGSIQRLA